MTVLDACIQVLRAAGKPLTVDEIHSEITKQGLYEFKAKDSRSIVRSALKRHVGKGANLRVSLQDKSAQEQARYAACDSPGDERTS